MAAAEVAAAEVATALGVRWEGAAREAETSRAEAAGLREQLQWEQLQRGRQVEALEVELVAGRGALATAKELVLVVSEGSAGGEGGAQQGDGSYTQDFGD